MSNMRSHFGLTHLLLATVLLAGACGASSSNATTSSGRSDNEQSARVSKSESQALFAKAESGVTIGQTLRANRFSDIYFSGQPKAQDFIGLKEQGFATVISLRSPEEYDAAAERAAAEGANLTFISLPFESSAELSDELIAEVTAKVVAERAKGKVLVHCTTGNRAATWAGGHFYKDHRLSKSEAIKMAELLGLTHPGAKAKLVRYLDTK